MDRRRQTLLETMAAFGTEHDRRTVERERKMLNITPDTGALLNVLVKAMRARRVLEIGTSNGYSTIWLADAAAAIDGCVATVESSDFKAAMARSNFEKAGLSSLIALHAMDADAYLTQQPRNSFDFIFLDSDREQYVAWWFSLAEILAPGGLLVVDNAVSHAKELEAFTDIVQATRGFTTVLVPVGNGERIIFREIDKRE